MTTDSTTLKPAPKPSVVNPSEPTMEEEKTTEVQEPTTTENETKGSDEEPPNAEAVETDQVPAEAARAKRPREEDEESDDEGFEEDDDDSLGGIKVIETKKKPAKTDGEVVRLGDDERVVVPEELGEFEMEPITMTGDGLPKIKKLTLVCNEWTNWMGVYVPGSDANEREVWQLSNGAHFQCNEPANEYAMKFFSKLAIEAVKSRRANPNTRSITSSLIRLYYNEMERLMMIHDGYYLSKIAERQMKSIDHVLQGFVTKEGPNGLIEPIVYHFCMTRLGKKGFRYDGDATMAIRRSVITVIHMMSDLVTFEDDGQMWPMPMVYLVIGHMAKYSGLPEVKICKKSETQQEYDDRRREENTREGIRNYKKQVVQAWIVEKRTDVREMYQQFVGDFKENEDVLFPNMKNDRWTKILPMDEPKTGGSKRSPRKKKRVYLTVHKLTVGSPSKFQAKLDEASSDA